MRTLIIILIICWDPFLQPAAAQKKNKRNIYHAWVILEGSNIVERGYLYELKDSSLVISHKIATEPDYYPSYREIKIHEIKTLKLRKRGNVGRGILIGSLTGLVGGINISSDKKSKELC